MSIARLIVEELPARDSDVAPPRREIGIYEFVGLPSKGEVIGVQYEGDLNYVQVLSVIHFPIRHPFEPDPDWPSLQQKEASTHVIAKWVGIA